MSEALLEEPSATIPTQTDGSRGERKTMTLLTCIIRPESLEAVKEALNTLGVIGGMTVTDVRGFGRQRGNIEHYRGEEYVIRLLPKVKLEVAVHNEHVERVMTTIGNAARSGQVGDGKIFAVDLRAVMRIRTGERGANVL